MKSTFIDRIYLELTTTCNYKCGFCPHPLMKRARRHMTPELALKAIDEIHQEKIGNNIILNYLGETLMSPSLFEVIAKCHDYSMQSTVITNGSLLNEKNLNKLKKSKPSIIKVSWETPDDESFKIRGNPLYTTQQILNNTLDLISALKNVPTKIGIVLMTTDPHDPDGIDGIEIINDHPELEKVIKYLHQRLSPIASIKSMDQIKPEIYKQNLRFWNDPIWLNKQIFLEIRPVMRWGDVNSKKKLYPVKTGYCPKALKQEMGILVNGDIVMCCIDPEGETAVGNIEHNTLASVLNSKKTKRIVNDFENNIITLEKCQRCLGTPSLKESLINRSKHLIKTSLNKITKLN